MSDPIEPLILDLLEMLSAGPRPYAEVLDAWRTSCPRLPVWEEATARGFVIRMRDPGQLACVSLTAAGRAHLRATRPLASTG